MSNRVSNVCSGASLVFIASLMLAGCGGSEKDDPEPEDDAGIVVVTDGGHGTSDAGPVDIDAGPIISDGGSKCTQADQYCNADDRNGMRCKNGEWKVWTCDEGTTCSRADNGWLSCVPVGGEDGGIPQEDAGHDAGIHDAGIEDAGIPDGGIHDAGIDDAGIEDAGIVEPDAGPTQDDGFVFIPAGEFTLSHATAEHAEGDTVTVAAFKLGRTSVTATEFEKCVKAGDCTSEHYYATSTDNGCNYGDDSKADHPMNCVDLYGAKEYCAWAGGRLPTEEEWEYAATHNGRVHLNTMYPWGNDSPTSSLANYNNNVGSTTEVGHYSSAGDSPLGLVDMAGNVWEWTDSLYSSGSKSYILKGGGWNSDEDKLRVTYRDYNFPAVRNYISYGFRCAE